MGRIGMRYWLTLVMLFAVLAIQPGRAVPAAAAAQQAAVQAGKNGGTDAGFYRQPTGQIIVKYKAALENLRAAPDSARQAQRLSQAAGVALTYLRAMSGGAHVMKLAGKRPVTEVWAIAKRLAQLPEVEYAGPDRVLYPALAPNDPQYPSQWHYSAPASGSYGINLPAAWDITQGAASVVVGVIDTGITAHPEFSGRTVAGYDFITDPVVANDGGGRDADPGDPGDWIAADQCYAGSPAQNSTWHGTHTAGTIGAATNNGVGVAGINWYSKILPVRVLGTCGGSESDVADGMRWAAGLAVPGVPPNPNPAKVLNISLGGEGDCLAIFQSAIDDITAAGTTIVVAAGNSLADASGFMPANCSGVITVAATNRSGDMALYSNYGSVVEIAAPGGEMYSDGDPNGVLSTLNSGTTVPVSPTYGYYQGTSMAAPHVTGVVSLLYSVRPSLTPAEALYYVQSTATSFSPGSIFCTILSLGCGSGIVNAGAAVAAAAAGKINTTTAIATDLPDPSEVGQMVTVHYTVVPASGSGTPTGTVTVSAGTDSCSGSVAAGECKITFTSVGSKMITATYQGDLSYNGSVSPAAAHAVMNAHIYLPFTSTTR